MRHEAASTFIPGVRAFDDPALGDDLEASGLIRSLHDLDREARQGLLYGFLELRPLIAAVGKELQQKRKGAEQGSRHQRAPVAVLHVGGMNERVHQETLRVDEDVALLALDLFARVVAVRINARPPFSALFTL